MCLEGKGVEGWGEGGLRHSHTHTPIHPSAHPQPHNPQPTHAQPTNTPSTLRSLFSCQWEGPVRVRAGASAKWVNGGFAVLQGQRLLWWTSADELEAGRPADAQLLLQGHAGITAPSPQDVKDLGGEDLLVAVFGRSAAGPSSRTGGTQQRWVFVTATPEEKREFTEAIALATGVEY